MTRSRHFAGSRGGGHALDVPVAALAGLSVAFAAYVAPAALLGELVTSLGLPALIAAAQPPLGFTARLAIGAAGALGTFLVALLLLRWLGRFGGRGAEPELELVEEVEAPRVRRRDFHPDAPPRPPILAAAELGEPVLHPVAEIAAEPEPEPVPQPQPEPEPAAPAEPEPLRNAWLPETPAPAPSLPEPAPPPSFGTSIPELMARLERGLAARRPAPPPSAAAAAPRVAPAVFPDVADARLQSAIESLQRLAARQH